MAAESRRKAPRAVPVRAAFGDLRAGLFSLALAPVFLVVLAVDHALDFAPQNEFRDGRNAFTHVRAERLQMLKVIVLVLVQRERQCQIGVRLHFTGSANRPHETRSRQKN